MSTLNIERSGIYHVAFRRSMLDDLIAFAQRNRRRGTPLIELGWVRRGIAFWATEFEAQRMLSWHIVWLQGLGEEPSVDPSVQSLRMRMSQHPFACFGLEVLGMPGQLAPSCAWAPLLGQFEKLYLTSCSQHSGGTTEIQKNIIATRGLGLPRD